MTAIAVVGSQQGDGGEGKITDLLSRDAAIAVRPSGGNDVGHTIEADDKTFKMRLIPSGIFAARKDAVIGNGVITNPEIIFGELDSLKKEGIDTNGLRISNRAYVIMPYHILRGIYREGARGGKEIGTTKDDIGPYYMDKTLKIDIRVCDLLEGDTSEKKLRTNLTEKNALLIEICNKPVLKFGDISEKYLEYGQKTKKYVTGTSVAVNDALDKSEKVLPEGMRGIMLNIDEETYLYVAFSNIISGGIASGIGMSVNCLNIVTGVCKTHTTHVGEGPLPTELLDKVGDRTRETTHKYGTVTGRPCRVGWLDSVALRYTKRVVGIDALSLNLLDVLSGFDKIKIAIAYEPDGKKVDYHLASLKESYRCKSVHEELPVWDEDVTNVRTWEDLPENTKESLNHASELVGVPSVTVSVGPDRE